MNTNTFSVKEFSSIYSMLEENSNKLSIKSNQIIILCEQLSQIVKSEDSSLSASYSKIGETLAMVKVKIVDLLRQLEEEMKWYEARTVSNEEETTANLKEINANIENISAVFNSIAQKNS